MIKLAVFDIDRTLIAPEIGVIAPETLAALKQLQQKGIKIAIASGRLFSFLQPELLEVGFDYYIMSNGCYVTDRDGNILAREQLDPDLPEAFSREMGLEYQLLCARQVEFVHPMTKKTITIRSQMDALHPVGAKEEPIWD